MLLFQEGYLQWGSFGKIMQPQLSTIDRAIIDNDHLKTVECNFLFFK